MKKLTIEHSVGYLPYKLKVLNPENFRFNGMRTDAKTLTVNGFKDDYISFEGIPSFYPLESFKLILHPLSDLTKEIEVNGGKFVPMDALYEIFNKKLFTGLSKYGMNKKIELYVTCMPYFVVEKLLEWHFDIHGLIESGLAIDINKL